MVRPGTYEGNLTIEKPLQIVGDGLMDNIIIKINKRKDNNNALVIDSNRVTIQNISFLIIPGGDLKEALCYKKNKNFWTYHYEDYKTYNNSAIIIDNKNRFAMKSCNVYGGSNAIRNFCGQVILEQCNIFSCYRGVVSSGNLTILNCNISNMIEDGIYIIGGQKIFVEQSDIINNGGNGLYIWEGNAIIEKCNINENSNFGINIVDGMPSIQDCQLTGNTNGVSNVFSLQLWWWSFLSKLGLNQYMIELFGDIYMLLIIIIIVIVTIVSIIIKNLNMLI